MIRHWCHTVVAIAANRNEMVNGYCDIHSIRDAVAVTVEQDRSMVDLTNAHCCRYSRLGSVEKSTAPRAASFAEEEMPPLLRTIKTYRQ